MYVRNQCFALSFLLACVQILDFLSFHHLFGPWAIIIGDLMKDLGRFLVVLAIFVFGFSMHIVALNQPFKNMTPEEVRLLNKRSRKTQYFHDGKFKFVTSSPFLSQNSILSALYGDTECVQHKKQIPEIFSSLSTKLKIIFCLE